MRLRTPMKVDRGPAGPVGSPVTRWTADTPLVHPAPGPKVRPWSRNTSVDSSRVAALDLSSPRPSRGGRRGTGGGGPGRRRGLPLTRADDLVYPRDRHAPSAALALDLAALDRHLVPLARDLASASRDVLLLARRRVRAALDVRLALRDVRADALHSAALPRDPTRGRRGGGEFLLGLPLSLPTQ